MEKNVIVCFVFFGLAWIFSSISIFLSVAFIVAAMFSLGMYSGSGDGFSYDYEEPNKELDNNNEDPNWYVTSETKGSPDEGYVCTIRSIKYGAIWGVGQTAEEAEDDAHRRYELCKSKY